MKYDPIMCMMVEEKVNTKDGTYGTVLDYYNQMKGKSKSEVEKILASAEGNPNAYLAYKEWKKRYDKAKDAKAKDANTLYETFAHGNSKHAGVLEMNGKVKVVVWNEGDNPRTGKVTVIGEDTPANRSKAKSMLDSASAIDKAISTCDAASGDAMKQIASAK